MLDSLFKQLILLAVCSFSDVLLRTDYANINRTLCTEITSTMSLRTVRLETSRDDNAGEPIRVDDTEDVTNQVTICDRVLEHNQGRPQRVRRQFKVVESKIATVIGGNTQVREKRALLANVTLHLSRKHNGDVAYKLVDGRLPDDSSALEALHLELYTDALLPDGEEIGIGDKWDLENEDVRRALALDLTGSSLPPGVPSDAVWILIGGGGNGILDVVEFSGTAELSNLNVQYEDRTCAAIDIEIESSGRWSDVHREYDAGLPVVSTFHEIELHGRLLYDRTMNLPVFFEVEGTIAYESSYISITGTPMTVAWRREGDFHLTTRIGQGEQ